VGPSRWIGLALLTLLGLVPGVAGAQFTGLATFPSPAQVNVPVTIVVQGRNLTCNAVVIFGDGTPPLTLPGRQLPFTITHTYRRTGRFVVQIDCPGLGIRTTVVEVGTPAGSPFSLRRVELRWDNGRGDITVPKDFADLLAYADILFNGNGQLIVAWEVDGRTLSVQHEYLTFGGRTTLRTPKVPPVPTFEPGLHRLTLRVMQPPVSFQIPVITYFVQAAPAPPPRLELVAPGPGATIAQAPLAFQWKALAGAASYRVDLFDETTRAPLASAATRESEHALTPALERRLAPGGRYAWRVTALGESGAVVAESELRSFVWGGGAATAQAAVPGQVLVGLKLDAPAVIDPIVADLEARHGLRRVEVTALRSIDVALVLFEVTAGASVTSVVGALAADPRVQLVQPNLIFATSATPADPLANLQYGLGLIAVRPAHARLSGKGVRVAVVDSGVDGDHPDLAGRLGAQLDFTGGPPAAEVHGTLVAGVIGAVAGNAIGITGIAHGAELMGLRACRASQPGQAAARCTAHALARALDHALLNGARLINVSLGGPRDLLVTRVVERAHALGITVVAAVGNQGPGAPPLYPAALDSVIAVTAVDARGRLYASAIQGEFVALAAPGVEVLSTAPGARYSAHTGTSLAAAHVTGVAALLLEARPDLGPAALRTLLLETAQPPTGGRNRQVGHGLVNACRAAERALGESLGCPPR
jgi:hypothetical protein